MSGSAASPTSRCTATRSPPRPPTPTSPRTSPRPPPRTATPLSSWTGTHPRASWSNRSTPLRTARRRSSRDIHSTVSRVSHPTFAGRTRRCMSISRGRFASTRASRLPRSQTRSIGATWPAARRGCPSRSTWPPTADTTPTIRGCRAMSEWPGWQSIPFSTCGSCSTASTCRRFRCR